MVPPSRCKIFEADRSNPWVLLRYGGGGTHNWVQCFSIEVLMPVEPLLRQVLQSEALTRGLEDPEARVLVEWLADMVDQLATDTAAETTLPRSLDQLTQKARAIARFVSLWCQGERGSAVQLAAVERFTWPLPTTAVDPCELMKAILSREPVQRAA